MMILIFGALAFTVGAIASLALGTWLILVAVMVVHALASAVVIGYAWHQAGKSVDKPDPLTEARIEQEDDGEPPRAARTARDREVFS